MRAKGIVLALCLLEASSAVPVPTRDRPNFLRSLLASSDGDTQGFARARSGASSVARSSDSTVDRIAKLIDSFVPSSIRDSVSFDPLTQITNAASKARATSSGAAIAASVASNDDGDDIDTTMVIPVIATVDQNGVTTAKALDGVVVSSAGSRLSDNAGQNPAIIQRPAQSPSAARPVANVAAASPAPFTPVQQKAVPPANAVGIDGSAPLAPTSGPVAVSPDSAMQQTPANAPSTPNIAVTANSKPSLAEIAAANGFAIVPVKAGDVAGIAIIPMQAASGQDAVQVASNTPSTTSQAISPTGDGTANIGNEAVSVNVTGSATAGNKVISPSGSPPNSLPNGSRVLNKTPLGAGHMPDGVSDARREGAVNPVGSFRDSDGVSQDAATSVPTVTSSGSADARRAAAFQKSDSATFVLIDASSGTMYDDGSPFVSVIGGTSEGSLLPSDGFANAAASGNAPGSGGQSNNAFGSDGQLVDDFGSSGQLTNAFGSGGQLAGGSRDDSSGFSGFGSPSTQGQSSIGTDSESFGGQAQSGSITPGQPILPVG